MKSGFTFESPRAVLRIVRIMEALKPEPLTREALCAALSMSKATAIFYLKHLRGLDDLKAPRRIFIKRWEKTDGRYSPVYAVGASKDAREPARASGKVKYQRCKAAIDADPRRRALYLLDKRKARPDFAAAWIPRRDPLIDASNHQ